jgi:hypothetical protein
MTDDQVRYTDLARKTFDLSLRRLKGKIPDTLHAELEDLQRDGDLHNAKAIIQAIQKAAVDDGANQRATS